MKLAFVAVAALCLAGPACAQLGDIYENDEVGGVRSLLGGKKKPVECYKDKDCRDGDKCTEDFCKNGKCKHKDVVCVQPKDPCYVAECKKGECKEMPAPAGTKCNDYNGCTHHDKCDGYGKCVGKPRTDCDFDDECKFGFCKKGKCQVEYKPAGTRCKDGDKCTKKDKCDGYGTCVAGEDKVCPKPPDCKKSKCKDGDCKIKPDKDQNGQRCEKDGCKKAECWDGDCVCKCAEKHEYCTENKHCCKGLKCNKKKYKCVPKHKKKKNNKRKKDNKKKKDDSDNDTD